MSASKNTRRGSPKPSTAPKPSAPSPAQRETCLELPEHVQVSDGELAVLTRLVRVMRQADERGAYWLGPFIEWRLYLDITDPNLNYIQAPKVLQALRNMGADGQLLENDSRFIKAAMRECPEITFVSPLFASPKTTTKPPVDALAVGEEEQFYQLLRQWRLEYPEPQKPQQPTGHLGRGDESGD